MAAVTRGTTSSLLCCAELDFGLVHVGGDSGKTSSPRPSQLRLGHGMVELENHVYGPIGLSINPWC
jgi:hypothetical protein